MLFEISVIPLGGDIHLSDELAGVLSVVDRSGLPYQLGPGSTCIEGEWDEAMALIDKSIEQKPMLKHKSDDWDFDVRLVPSMNQQTLQRASNRRGGRR